MSKADDIVRASADEVRKRLVPDDRIIWDAYIELQIADKVASQNLWENILWGIFGLAFLVALGWGVRSCGAAIGAGDRTSYREAGFREGLKTCQEANDRAMSGLRDLCEDVTKPLVVPKGALLAPELAPELAP